MPVFRFNRAFSIARDVKVFLNLQSGVTRGAVPDARWYEKQTEALRNVIEEQRKMLKSKDQEIKEQAEALRNARQRAKEQKKTRKSKDQEIFRLKKELRAAEERVEGAPNGWPAPQAAGEPETGALPDFVIIGALKCGTTSLYHLLTRHPYVERAVLKELRYFDEHFEKGIEWYRSQFLPPRWKDGRRTITGEATPYYLFHPRVPERMAEVVPQARLIALLRNPVDRAYSQYHNEVRTLCETRSFEEAIEAEAAWLLGKEEEAPEPRASVEHPYFEYLRRGIYVDQLLRWSKFFSDEQMLVLKSEDFHERTLETLKLVLDFLDLSDWEPGALENRNKGRYKEMDPATRQWLEDFFKPHNQRLYEYLGVDFGW